MLRDFKFLRRKNSEEIENVPLNPRDSLSSQASSELSSRPPLNAIQDPSQQEVAGRGKVERTPTKHSTLPPLRTPERKYRFGWGHRNESSAIPGGEVRDDVKEYPRGGLPIVTPRSVRTVGREASSYSESTSTRTTPTKSVSKPPSSAYRSKLDANVAAGRVGNVGALYRGVPVAGASTPAVVNTLEVPHFELKEDPSFWMDHNVQVLVRVRPVNSMERSTQGYNRCLKQESAQTITWIGQPECRFTFDHVACETVDQEMLFRMAGLPMVENCLSGYNSCIFAYGQTGSGKTFTMLGEIDGLEVKPSVQRGMTPRIFEFLFARIQAEEESRRDERLQYSCKCSFLEIYNEQITDLLEPSSTNLMLREDVKAGVYVENLSEFEVHTVSDIIKLLAEGSLNRKVAATNMNRESSRSHSVFTCVIESRWVKDSTTNLRFARLNLVDLAGSERQKSSGAEGERLKEAASINKSLSTLGHVIMILVDVANGKQRHVPYRDSRLTYLLQDSLGGNSKTMIIANVSPSISCAAETLNTLKFAQRAKLIQNNAVVNEDSTGDVIALQHKIRLLKEEISLLKRQNVFRSLSFDSSHNGTDPVRDNISTGKSSEMEPLQASNSVEVDTKGTIRLSTKQLKSLESTLAGALRREQMAETAIKNLEAEIAQLNRLVRQREEDTRSTKMLLRFREDKIQRMESVLGGSLPHDSYLMEENKAMREETQLLQAKADKNPEVTRFALENIRLLEQIRRFQEFYEEGEREILLDEVSKLREQLLQFLDGTSMPHHHLDMDDQIKLKNTADELERSKQNLNSCLEENQKLSRQIDDLHRMLEDVKSAATAEDIDVRTRMDSVDTECAAVVVNHAEEVLHLQLELDIMKIIVVEERSSKEEAEEKARLFSTELELVKESLLLLNKQFQDAAHELKETKLVVEALESDQMLAISDIEKLREDNDRYVKLLRDKEDEVMDLKDQISLSNEHLPKNSDDENSVLLKKLKRMQVSIEKAKKMNMRYYNDLSCQASKEAEVDDVRRQAEAETAEVIISLEEELVSLQQQVQGFHSKETETESSMMLLEAKLKETHDKLDMLTEENNELLGKLENKEEELRELSQEWELLACEMEEILADGHNAIIDASHELEEISSSFPEKRVWISEQVSRLIRTVSEKELLVEELGKCLEDANHRRSEVDQMIKSLKSATQVINEAHEQECNEKEMEIVSLKCHLREQTSAIVELEDKVKLANDHKSNASVCASIGFVLAKTFSEANLSIINELRGRDVQLSELAEINRRQENLLRDHSETSEVAEAEIRSLRMEIGELKKMCSDLQQAVSEEEKRASSMQLQLEVIEENDILQTKKRLAEFKTEVSSLHSCMSNNLQDDHTSKISERLQACAQDDDSRELNEVGSPKHTRERDTTISLLKQEIGSALASLQEVKVEMCRLHAEKEQSLISERQNKETMEFCTTQLLSFDVAMGNFEENFERKIDAASHKLDAFEEIIQETMEHWSGTKECVEMEIDDAKLIAVEKAAEASCLFAKYEEAQETMKEADIMINKLMMANDMMKLELENEKQVGMTLMNEREKLMEELHILQTANCHKNQQIEELERQFTESMEEMAGVVGELEVIVAGFQSSFQEDYLSMAGDLDSLRTFALNSRKLVGSWLEDIWSEIVVKDCAVSVLHLCHMGILLETVTGLHAENGLLQNGLCETNSVIVDLKERNTKSSEELHICRTLKGKLLADIKRSFDRISKKESEMCRFGAKLTSFEKHIFDLQLQEESMLERSNYMGSQLAILMKELDSNNKDVIESLLNREQMLMDKEEYLNSEADHLLLDTWSKELESCILASELKEITYEAEKMIGSLKKDLDFKSAEVESSKSCLEVSNMEKQTLQDKIVSLEVNVSGLQADLKMKCNEVNELSSQAATMADLCSSLNSQADLLLLDTWSKELESFILALQLKETTWEAEKVIGSFKEDLEFKSAEVESCRSCAEASNMEKQTLQDKIVSLEANVSSLQADLEMKSNEVNELLSSQSAIMADLCSSLNSQADLYLLDTWSKELESCILASELKETTWEAEKVTGILKKDLESRRAEIESCRRCIEVSNMEKQTLQDKIVSLEVNVSGLQADLEMKCNEVNELLSSQSATMADLCSERQDVQRFVRTVKKLEDENALLQDELRSSKLGFREAFNRLSSRNLECLHALETLQSSFSRVSNAHEEGRLNELSRKLESIFDFIQETGPLECCAESVVSDNLSLQAELSRKDEILEGVLSDLSLLQESASNAKDQKDEIEEIMAAMEVLEDELAAKSEELDEATLNTQTLEAQLEEKMVRVSALEAELTKESESLESFSRENVELRAQIKDVLAAKSSLELELAESKNLTESLEMELSRMSNVLRQMDSETEYLQSSLNELTDERDQLLTELNVTRQQLEKAETLVEEKEAVAVAAQQEVEYRKLYAEDKETEVKLLERSIAELECTINVLENKVDNLNDEAERQRLQREDLEVEIHSLKDQMQTFESSGSDTRRHLEEKKKALEDALDHIETLKSDITGKNAEIAQFKSHISELNLHAEAQASEYKQKFKQLEAMLEQVKNEGSFNHVANTSTNKPEKLIVKPRGSGSPFKCIGLGMAQQVKSEKDEEMSASRQRIEELECLAASRQKEIFSLHARLAAAESMTHDVIRDLLGVKLDMTNYASLLNNQQLQKIAEKAQLSSSDHETKDNELTIQLKQQLNEFIDERRGWLEEIDRRQTELVAAQVALENLRQQDQFLKAENEMLKMETVSHKKQVMELEGEVKKLSGQQNLQQRIHHHAKIKEENNLLKMQNDELSSKLQRSELVLSRARDEFKRYRASIHGWNCSQER